MDSPNLFRFATSELSQDAFICWLLSWADKDYEASDRALHEAGTALLDRLLKAGEIKKPSEYHTLEIKKQHNNIDVLVLVNENIAVIIEDKTHTKDHSKQLKRYREDVEKEYPAREIAAIYFKTGDQSNFNSVKEAHYHRFLRKDFLDILEEGIKSGVKNDIFIDFHRHLQGIEDRVNEYRTLPVNEWHNDCSIGFFMELQRQLRKGNWGYVSNPNGGFMGFWWPKSGGRYLQLEHTPLKGNKKEQDALGALHFKIEVEEKSERKAKSLGWYNALMKQEKPTPMGVMKPNRRRTGKTMTVATLKKDGREDYRQTDERGMLDMEKTLSVLQEAEKFSDAAQKVDESFHDES